MQNPKVVSLERAPIRTRESGVTQSAWRMEIECDEGRGSITQLDNGIHRGDGVCLGMTQEELASLYVTLNAPAEETPFETMQLG